MRPHFSRLSATLALALAPLAVIPDAWAHHSFAMFDANKTLTVHCTVKDLQWGNPHTWLDVVAANHAAQTALSLEMNGISGLRQRGWTPTTLKPGDQITITYHPMRDGTPAGRLVKLVTANGRTLSGR